MIAKMPLCKVIIANSKQSFAFSKDFNTLSYSIPEALLSKLKPGSLVMVPLRKSKENALVIETMADIQEGTFKLRDVEELVLEQFCPPDLIELIKYTADYYACSYSDVLSAILPGSLMPRPSPQIKINPKFNADNLSSELQKLWTILSKARGGQMRYSRLRLLSKLDDPQLNKYIQKLSQLSALSLEHKLIKTQYKSIPNPLAELGLEPETSVVPELNADQARVLSSISYISKIESSPKFLLHGVTGSGKTEIYLRLIQETLEQGKSSIVLVPEISLAPQIISRISSRIDPDKVLVWHSALSKSERQYTWDRILSAQINSEPLVVVGARSAVFAPLSKLGLIVLDEEHENSYKQDSPSPRYHAGHLAAKRANLVGDCVLVYGSATPSVELYYRAISKDYPDYHLLELPKRVFAASLPKVEIIDMREEFMTANRSVFSRKLKQALDAALEAQEQSILFLNRRGAASHVFCRSCGHVYNCPNCSAKIIYHSDSRLMICHHCAYREEHPSQCGNCGASSLKFFGLGTQRLEEETRKSFPQARVARLDSDVSAYLEVLRKFKNREIDILIGTQMIAKGLDLANLTTVGVIAADTHFMQLDYQAEERAFQLLTQVAGRAGRRDKQGSVYFQTYNPDRELLLEAAKQDYQAFYAREILERQESGYPPYSSLLRVIAVADAEIEAQETLEDLKSYLEEHVSDPNTYLLGPSPCVLSKLKTKYRYHLLIKSKENTALIIVRELCLAFKQKLKNNIVLLMDVDSLSLY